MCPAWLPAAAKVEWRRIVPELRAVGLVTRLDRAGLSAYCLAWAELQEATQILGREGRILVSKVHPAVKLQRDAFTRLKQFLAEFGLTPASRTRFDVQRPGAAADEFEQFLGKKA